MNADQRAKVEGDKIEQERPSLLDPCDLDDVKLLTFHRNGRACEANRDETSNEYLRANISIEVYHLNHNTTKRERKRIAIKVRDLVKDINDFEAESPKNHQKIKKGKRELIALVYERAPFYMTAKTYLREYDNDDYPWVSDLLDVI